MRATVLHCTALHFVALVQPTGYPWLAPGRALILSCAEPAGAGVGTNYGSDVGYRYRTSEVWLYYSSLGDAP